MGFRMLILSNNFNYFKIPASGIYKCIHYAIPPPPPTNTLVNPAHPWGGIFGGETWKLYRFTFFTFSSRLLLPSWIRYFWSFVSFFFRFLQFVSFSSCFVEETWVSFLSRVAKVVPFPGLRFRKGNHFQWTENGYHFHRDQKSRPQPHCPTPKHYALPILKLFRLGKGGATNRFFP